MRPRVRSVLVSCGLIAASLAMVGTTPVAGAALPRAGAVRPASAGAPARPFVLERGVTKPVYSYANAIRQSVWVKAPDGDGDGKKDLVTVDIVRPRELDGAATIP